MVWDKRSDQQGINDIWYGKISRTCHISNLILTCLHNERTHIKPHRIHKVHHEQKKNALFTINFLRCMRNFFSLSLSYMHTNSLAWKPDEDRTCFASFTRRTDSWKQESELTSKQEKRAIEKKTLWQKFGALIFSAKRDSIWIFEFSLFDESFIRFRS